MIKKKSGPFGYGLFLNLANFIQGHFGSGPFSALFHLYYNTDLYAVASYHIYFILLEFPLSPFYMPVKDGTYYVITCGGRAGGVPYSLSGAYLQDYASYGYETSWVDRSHQGGVQCTGTITLACLIFELLPFVYFSYLNFIFILEFCPEHISKTILAMVMKFCWWIDLIKGECSAQEP